VSQRLLTEILSIKLEVHPVTCHYGKRAHYKCSTTLSLTSAIDGVGGEYHALVALSLAKTLHQSYRGTDKSLARPGRKQGRATREFEFYIYYL